MLLSDLIFAFSCGGVNLYACLRALSDVTRAKLNNWRGAYDYSGRSNWTWSTVEILNEGKIGKSAASPPIDVDFRPISRAFTAYLCSSLVTLSSTGRFLISHFLIVAWGMTCSWGGQERRYGNRIPFDAHVWKYASKHLIFFTSVLANICPRLFAGITPIFPAIWVVGFARKPHGNLGKNRQYLK